MLYAVDDDQDHDQHEWVLQQGEGDAPESLQAGGAVHLGRLVVVLGNIEQTGQKDDRGVAVCLPHVGDGHAVDGLGRAADEALRRNLNEAEQVVDQTEAGVVEPQEEHGDSDLGDDNGHEDEEEIKIAPAPQPLQQKGQPK